MTSTRHTNRLLAVVIVGVITATGFGFLLGRSTNSSRSAQQISLNRQFATLQSQLPLRLAADSASGGKTVSMATGSVIEGADGLFILDHMTGILQCWILNPRNGDVGGIYVVDVNAAMGLDKGDPDFVMTTGEFFLRGRRGNMDFSDTICYVAEGKSGKAAGFSLSYDKTGIQSGVVQKGEMRMVCSGPIRQAGAIRQ